jgi:hypothetical protein
MLKEVLLLEFSKKYYEIGNADPPAPTVKSCMDSGLGIRLTKSKSGPIFDSWIPPSTSKRSFYVGDGKGEDIDVAGEKTKEFQFALVRPKLVWGAGNNSNVERSAKGLFTAEKWNWVTEPEGNSSSGQLKNIPRP